MAPVFSAACHVRQPSRDKVGQCKLRVRDMIHSLKAKIGNLRAAGRYHPEGTRSLENDYAVKKQVLGDGMNGYVRLATGRHLRSSDRFAIKSFDLQKISSNHGEADLLSELEIHMSVDHPHIVRIVDIYEARSELHVVMECMDGGELIDRMIERRKFNEDDAAETIHQILLAVSYLHDNCIVHRDLKPENLLYDKGGSHLKLTDFGFASRWKEGDAKLHVPCGSVPYVAPEVLNLSYTNQCDLWSVGVIAYGLLKGHLPFNGTDAQVVADIQACNLVINEEDTLSEKAGAFIRSLLKPDYQQRLTACAALNHPWLVQNRCRSQIPCLPSYIIEGLRDFQRASSLQRVSCLVRSLAPTDGLVSSDVHHLFMEMDTYRTGLVRMEDLKEVLSEKFGKADELDELVSNFFNLLDADDGSMPYSVFLAVMESATWQHKRGSLADVFRRFDVQNAGRITKEHVRDFLDITAEDDDNVGGLFKDLDLDEKNKYIKYPAFEARLVERPAAMQPGPSSGSRGCCHTVSRRADFGPSWNVVAAIFGVISQMCFHHLGTILGASSSHKTSRRSWMQRGTPSLGKCIISRLHHCSMPISTNVPTS